MALCDIMKKPVELKYLISLEAWSGAPFLPLIHSLLSCTISLRLDLWHCRSRRGVSLTASPPQTPTRCSRVMRIFTCSVRLITCSSLLCVENEGLMRWWDAAVGMATCGASPEWGMKQPQPNTVQPPHWGDKAGTGGLNFNLLKLCTILLPPYTHTPGLLGVFYPESDLCKAMAHSYPSAEY